MSILHPTDDEEVTVEDLLAWGDEARARLMSPIAARTRAEVERRILARWLATEPGDLATREKLHACMVALTVADEVYLEMVAEAEVLRAEQQKRDER